MSIPPLVLVEGFLAWPLIDSMSERKTGVYKDESFIGGTCNAHAAERAHHPRNVPELTVAV